jgi:hypothetical protein
MEPNKNALEAELKVNDNMTVKLNLDSLVSGAKDRVENALRKSVKVNIPSINIDDDPNDSFERRYEERKLD